jgi:hypothetical protein
LGKWGRKNNAEYAESAEYAEKRGEERPASEGGPYERRKRVAHFWGGGLT